MGTEMNYVSSTQHRLPTQGFQGDYEGMKGA